MNNFLVIGSNSFSGMNFCHLLRKKKNNFIAVSRSPQKDNFFRPYNAKNEIFFQLDLNKNRSDILKLIKKFEINKVINFASQSMVGESWLYPQDWYHTNILSTTSFYDSLSEFKNIKLIHVSTPEVYGSCKGLVKENNFFNPSTPYAVSRAAADYHLRNLKSYKNFNYVITRASNVYGVGQDLYRLIPKVIYRLLQNKKFPLHGGGKSKRNFIEINDVCEATYALSVSKTKYDEYHISGEEVNSIIEIVRMIAEELNLNFNSFIEITEDRAGKDEFYLLDSSRLKSEFSWSAKTEIQIGIKSVIKWLKSNQKFFYKFNDIYEHKI